jgi:glutathione S-transferase
MDLAAAPSAIELSDAVVKDVRRIVALWRTLLERFHGPWLGGGEWGIVDAFFTPVATRFQTYGVRLADHGDDGSAAAYAERLLARPEYLAWKSGV